MTEAMNLFAIDAWSVNPMDEFKKYKRDLEIYELERLIKSIDDQSITQQAFDYYLTIFGIGKKQGYYLKFPTRNLDIDFFMRGINEHIKKYELDRKKLSITGSMMSNGEFALGGDGSRPKEELVNMLKVAICNEIKARQDQDKNDEIEYERLRKKFTKEGKQ